MKTTYIIAILFSGILFVLTTNPAFALSCAGPAWDEEFDNVDVVFIGTVTEKKYSLNSEVATSTILVEEIFKGSVDDIVKIQSEERFFGITLLEDWRYLIFAFDKGDHLSVGLCTRSDAVPPIPSSDINMQEYAKHNMIMLDIILMEKKPAPLQQLEQGVYHTDVICNSDFVLIGKIDGFPACVRQSSIAKLVERGWTNPYYSQDGSIDTFEECAAAGNPVMESHPRQCHTPDGKHFVEGIEQLQMCSRLYSEEETCPAGYICYDETSGGLTPPGTPTEPIKSLGGDQLCHKECETNDDCTSNTPICKRTSRQTSDYIESFMLCFSES